MKISLIFCIVSVLFLPIFLPTLRVEAPITCPKTAIAETMEEASPARIEIPAAQINSPVEKVGIDRAGNMAVPDGTTQKVGWYSLGTKPGEIGTAVFAAHVFAAFKNLKNLKLGDLIYIEGEDGSKLTFVIDEIHDYKLKDLSAGYLFNRKDGMRIALITCAGVPTHDTRGYSDRLVIFASIQHGLVH